MKKFTWLNYVGLISLLSSLVIFYFSFREDTVSNMANAEISDAQITAEVEKLKIRIENLELNKSVNDRDKQNMKNDFNNAINKVDTKLDNIYNILIKK